MVEEHRQDMVMSYHRVRTALGILGMALPLVLIVGGLLDYRRIEPSISDFYHTTYREILVGTLCASGVCLICYRVYGRRTGDVIDDDRDPLGALRRDDVVDGRRFAGAQKAGQDRHRDFGDGARRVAHGERRVVHELAPSSTLAHSNQPMVRAKCLSPQRSLNF